ncbi:hypothetical protein EDD36DRAFT_42542 [Exophiala viscosa]|uniref:RING-type domain-containing protein n=1 Tax=Exophiala viscosa TaxID=2486360 RepID=A0AAN6E6E6_9EURO|nr:hypothetical protein EDD36DRAFT_42542 [Exophiala viscosa]
MYIPQQQTLSTPAISASAAVKVPTHTTFVLRAAIPSAKAEKNSTTESHTTSFNHDAIAFVAVVVTVLFCLVTLLIKSVHRDDDSVTSSITSESAWRVDFDPDSPDRSVVAKHHKRLKKLEQVAPAQSLSHWRAEKQETHVQTFATASTRLICAICIDLIQDSDRIRELHCGHVYHSQCLNLWVERGHHECPLCKYDILDLQKQAMKAHGLQDAGRVEEQYHGSPNPTGDAAPAVTTDEQPVQIQDSPAQSQPASDEAQNEASISSAGANAEEAH